MPRAPYRSELLDGDVVVLVTITWAGKDWRFSSRPVEVEDADGEVLVYDGGIDDPDIEQTIDGLGSEPELDSVSLELMFPVSVSDLVERGYPLSRATGEVALHIVGQIWEDREIVVKGPLVQPEYGGDGEACSISIEAEPLDTRAAIPDVAATVTATTWPTAATGDIGKIYPTVGGTPGRYVSSTTAVTTSGSPALLVAQAVPGTTDTLLLSDGWVAAATVTIFDSTTSEVFTVSNTTDGDGRPVAVVSITGAATISRTESEYWAGWHNGGGIRRPDGTLALMGAGETCEWFLDRSGIEWDHGRWAAARQFLDRYRLGWYFDSSISPMEWLQDNLLSILPVALATGPNGVYPIVWPLRARREDAVETITAGDGATADGRITYTLHRRDAVGEVRLSYALRAKTGDYRGRYDLVSVPEDISTGGTFDRYLQHSSHLGRVQAGRKIVAVKELSTDVVYDPSTAALVAADQLQLYGAETREAVYLCDQRFRWLRRGQVVLLTDEERNIDEAVAVVRGRALLSSGHVSLTLELRELLARDIRRVT